MEQDNTKKGFFDRLKSGLAKTRKLLLTDVDDIILGSKEIDQALFDELEEALIVADVGPTFTGELIASLKEQGTAEGTRQPGDPQESPPGDDAGDPPEERGPLPDSAG